MDSFEKTNKQTKSGKVNCVVPTHTHFNMIHRRATRRPCEFKFKAKILWLKCSRPLYLYLSKLPKVTGCCFQIPSISVLPILSNALVYLERESSLGRQTLCSNCLAQKTKVGMSEVHSKKYILEKWYVQCFKKLYLLRLTSPREKNRLHILRNESEMCVLLFF